MSGVEGKLGVALFGCGRAGTIHFHNVLRHRQLSLRWIVEIEPGRAQAEALVEENYLKGQTTVTTWEKCDELFSDPQVHFVVVTTPTREHEKVVSRALQAGKGVFCEKPIALSLDATEALYCEAKRLCVPLYCCFQRRFDPGFSSLRDKVKQGSIGKLHMVTSFSRDSPVPSLAYLRTSGGIFHDCGVHDIDLVSWVVGEDPCSVFVQAKAHQKEIGEMGDVDTAAIILTYPSGVLGTIHLSRHSKFYDQRLEAHGDQGVVCCANPPSTSLEFGDAAGFHTSPLQFSFPTRYRVAYAAELDHFVDVLTKKVSALMVTCDDTLRASRVATACDQSFKTGQPISLK